MVVPLAYYLEQQELSLAASCPAPCVSRVPPAVQCGHDTFTKFRKYTVVQVLRNDLSKKFTRSHVAYQKTMKIRKASNDVPVPTFAYLLNFLKCEF